MYLSASISPNYKDVIVWERDKHGQRDVKIYPAPWYFYVRDEDGKDKDIHGNKLTKLEFTSSKQMRETRDRFKSENEAVYESDIRAEYKVLSEHYYNSEVPKAHIMFLDIEVDYNPEIGFSTIDNPYAPISSVALLKHWTGEMIVLAVPSSETFTMDDVDAETLKLAKIILCENERELLKKFYDLIHNSDILVGWNSDFFDIPYIYERTIRLFGEEGGRLLNFPEIDRSPNYREVEKFGVVQKILNIYGRDSLDYLEVFKKFESAMRPSYKLESIAEDELPHLPKLEYEGSLADLYRKDFNMFLRYNIRDTEILGGLEAKFGYIQLAVHMAHMSTGLTNDVLGTVKLAEASIINYCHYVLNARVQDMEYSETSGEKFAGALVLDPQVGMHPMVAAIDIASLYPSAIRSLNISPETIRGQFFEAHKAYEAIRSGTNEILYLKFDSGEIESRTASEWRNYLLDHGYSLSGSGAIFDQSKSGFIPQILAEWFAIRKDYKKKYEQAKAKAEELKKSGGNKEAIASLIAESEYCYRIQYIYKIKLNSMYGVLGNKFFKFFDVRLAESTTRSGREILMHMVRKTAECLDGTYCYPSESTVYSDTDSCYFKTHADDIQVAIKVGESVQKVVNNSFPPFMSEAFLCNDNFNNLIKAELDVISTKCIFVAKKMYIMDVAYAEGFMVDKMKIMGLQLKKTTIPKAISKKLTEFIKALLKGKIWAELGEEIVNYKDALLTTPEILSIGLPKGIKGIEEYTRRYEANEPDLRLPGHVSAALFWNLCLDAYGDKENPKIISGSKIKTFYLTQKFGRFTSIAIPTDTVKLPDWFVQHYVPLIDKEKQIDRLVNNPLKSILNAIGESIPTKQGLLFDSLVEY